MLTNRDLIIAILAVSTTLGLTALGQSGRPLMGSSIFDWNSLEAKPTKVGARRDVFQTPTATLDELECHITTLNSGEIPHPPHQHPDEELIIMKEGTVEVQQGDAKPKLAGPGSIIFEASNQMHGMRNVGKTVATYYVIRWKSPGSFKNTPKQ